MKSNRRGFIKNSPVMAVLFFAGIGAASANAPDTLCKNISANPVKWPLSQLCRHKYLFNLH